MPILLSIAESGVKDSSVTSAAKGLLNKIRPRVRLPGRGRSCSAIVRTQPSICAIFCQHVLDSADDGHEGQVRDEGWGGDDAASRDRPLKLH